MGDKQQVKHAAIAPEITVPVGVIVERQTIDNAWADDRWKPVSVFLGESPLEPWSVMMETQAVTRYHAGIFPLTLYRSDTSAYLEAEAAGRMAIYVVMSTDGATGGRPFACKKVTASPYEMQDHLDAGDDTVEAVTMPEPLVALVSAFIEEHHTETPFRKRKRDRAQIEKPAFGKEPIFNKGPLEQ